MTAKEALREYIDTELDEAEAEWVLEFLLRRPLHEPPPLTSEQMARIDEGRRQAREGRSIPHVEAMGRLGISD